MYLGKDRTGLRPYAQSQMTQGAGKGHLNEGFNLNESGIQPELTIIVADNRPFCESVFSSSSFSKVSCQFEEMFD